MPRTRCLLAALLCCAPLCTALAQTADGPDGGIAAAPDAGTPDDEALRKELEKSLQQDARSTPAAQQTGIKLAAYGPLPSVQSRSTR